MKKVVNFLIFMRFLIVFGQDNAVSGLVLDSDGNTVPNILVQVLSVNKSTITYQYTNNKGEFLLSLNDNYNDLYLKVTSLFYEDVEMAIDLLGEEKIVIKMVDKIESLDEVVITSSKRNKDTVNLKIEKYNLNKYESIENSLKKIPGISVDKDGRIKYFNKEIEKILIDGDDLANNQYTFISKHLRTEVIEDIQVLKNFEENTVLKQIQKSDKIALNLKVKNKFKNIWFGNISLGYGYGEKKGSVFNESLNLGLLKQKVKFLEFFKYSTLGDRAAPVIFNENNSNFSNNSLYGITKFNIELPVEVTNFNKALSNTLLFNTKIKNYAVRGTNFIGVDKERQNYYKTISFFTDLKNPTLEKSIYDDRKILFFGDLEVKNSSSENSYFVNNTRYSLQSDKFSSNNSINNKETSDESKIKGFFVQNSLQYTNKVSSKITLDNFVDIGYSNFNENALIKSKILANKDLNQIVNKKHLFLDVKTEFSYLFAKNIKCDFLFGNKYNKESFEIMLNLSNKNTTTFDRNEFVIQPSLIYQIYRNAKIKSSFQSNIFKLNRLKKTLFNFDVLLSLKFWAGIDLYYAKKQNFPINQDFLENYYLINNYTYKRGGFFYSPINYDLFYIKINKKNRKNTLNNEVFISYKNSKSSLLETYKFIDGVNYTNTSLKAKGDECLFKNQLVLLIRDMSFKFETTHTYMRLPLNDVTEELSKSYNGNYSLEVSSYFFKKLNFNVVFEYDNFSQGYKDAKTTFNTKKAIVGLDYNLDSNISFNLKGGVYELNKQYYKIFNASIGYNPKNKKLSYGLRFNNIFNESDFSFQDRNSFYQTNTLISLVPFYAFANVKYIF